MCKRELSLSTGFFSIGSSQDAEALRPTDANGVQMRGISPFWSQTGLLESHFHHLAAAPLCLSSPGSEEGIIAVPAHRVGGGLMETIFGALETVPGTLINTNNWLY